MEMQFSAYVIKCDLANFDRKSESGFGLWLKSTAEGLRENTLMHSWTV